MPASNIYIGPDDPPYLPERWKWSPYNQRYEFDPYSADPAMGTDVVYGPGSTEHFDQGQNPTFFLNAGPNYDYGMKGAVPGTDLYSQLQSDERTRNQQGIGKVLALVGGGALLGGSAWNNPATSGGYASGTATGTDLAFGSTPGAAGGLSEVALPSSASYLSPFAAGVGTAGEGLASAAGTGAAGASTGTLASNLLRTIPRVAGLTGLGAGGGSMANNPSSLQDIALSLFNQTDPLRQLLIGNSTNFLNGNMDVTGTPMYRALKSGTENQYSQARNSIIADSPAGGPLQKMLADLENSRAQTLAQGQGQIAQDELNRAMGLATGSTNTATNALGQASSIQQLQANADAQRSAGLYGAIGSGLGAYLGSK